VKAITVWLILVFFLAVGVSRVIELRRAAIGPATFCLTVFQGLIPFQAILAWLAYRSCKRTNAEAVKAASRPAFLAAQLAQEACFKEIKGLTWQVIVLSAIALLMSLVGYIQFSPPMGGLGHFAHDIFAPVLFCMAVWGLATGIGLLRASRWAWISMLIFGGLLTTACALLSLPFFLMPGGGSEWGNVVATRAVGVLLFLVPAAIGARWFRFFLRDNVKFYFQPSRKTPTALA